MSILLLLGLLILLFAGLDLVAELVSAAAWSEESAPPPPTEPHPSPAAAPLVLAPPRRHRWPLDPPDPPAVVA